MYGKVMWMATSAYFFKEIKTNIKLSNMTLRISQKLYVYELLNGQS